MSVRIDKGRLGGGLELTPMIDVVFLLMIFFLVASKLEEDDRAIDVILPQASAAKPLTTRPREFIINIDRGGNTYAGARPVAAEELVGLLRQAVADNPGRQKVTVRADENVAHKHVVAVMDACVQAGIEDYRVQSAPEVNGDRAAGPDDALPDDR
jgi:biopolymer transport protein ExbD